MRFRWVVLFVVMLLAVTSQANTTVIVTMTGLASLRDSPGSSSPTPKTLYLVDASNASGSHIVPHIGVIVVPNDYTAKVLDSRKGHTEGKFNWVKLKGAEKVSFLEKSSTPLSYYESKPPLCPDLTTDSEQSNTLYFFPRLSKVSRKGDGTKPIDGNDLDPSHLKPVSSDKKITAFMDINFGNIKAKIVQPVVWAFKESAKSIGAITQQMMAEKAIWTFEIAEDKLTLQTSTDGGTPVSFLELHQKGGLIELTIANAPDNPHHIGVKNLAKTAHQSVSSASEHHFALYYDFLKSDVAKTVVRYIPIAAGVCNAANDFQTDPCLLRKYVDIPDPGNCRMATAPIFAIGGLNCGPDNLP